MDIKINIPDYIVDEMKKHYSDDDVKEVLTLLFFSAVKQLSELPENLITKWFKDECIENRTLLVLSRLFSNAVKGDTNETKTE